MMTTTTKTMAMTTKTVIATRLFHTLAPEIPGKPGAPGGPSDPGDPAAPG